jgi:hypothetical protein
LHVTQDLRLSFLSAALFLVVVQRAAFNFLIPRIWSTLALPAYAMPGITGFVLLINLNEIAWCLLNATCRLRRTELAERMLIGRVGGNQ